MSAPGPLVPKAGPDFADIRGWAANQSGARMLALVLIVAIIVLRGVFSGRIPVVWEAIWGPVKPLGEGFSTVRVPNVQSSTVQHK
jgi:hypothetical protein